MHTRPSEVPRTVEEDGGGVRYVERVYDTMLAERGLRRCTGLTWQEIERYRARNADEPKQTNDWVFASRPRRTTSAATDRILGGA